MEKVVKLDKYLLVNQKLLVEVRVGNYPGIYDSRIEDIKDGKIYISMPTEKGRAIPLIANTRLHISYVMDMGRFSFKSMVEDRIKTPLPNLIISYPDAVFREELRTFFRVETRIPIKILVPVKSENDILTHKLFDAKAVDISGGGLRLFADVPAYKDSIIDVFLMGTVEKLDQIKAQVMRCRRVEDKYEIGLKFLELSATDRDKIIKYVFKRQIEMRKLLG